MRRALWFAALLLCGSLCGCVTSYINHLTGESQASDIRTTGKPAVAQVLRIWDTGMTLNDDPVVGFRLSVRAEGLEPFEVETKALVGRLDVCRVQPGAEVPVVYDPNDHSRVALAIYAAPAQ